jgi:allantoinase
VRTPYDLLIYNGYVVLEHEIIKANIAIRNGRFSAILDPEEKPEAVQQIDAKGLYLLPGIIDTHVHFREPGHEDREDFLSGTQAAAAGGVTTVIDMPTSIPTVHSRDIFLKRVERLSTRSIVDFALYAAAGHDNIDEISGLAAAGAIAFKTFLHSPPPERAGEFHGLWCSDEGLLLNLLQETAKTGLLHCFHAEHDAIISSMRKEMLSRNQIGYGAHTLSRPTIAEELSVAVLITLAETTGSMVQVVHVSSPAAAERIQEAQKRGIQVTAETAPHYLSFDDSIMERSGPFARINPPFRTASEKARLWDYIDNGTLQMIGSDHSPFLLSEKEKGYDNIFNAPSGIPGIEAMLPLMLTAVANGFITLPKLTQLMAGNASRIFGLPNKGKIALGYDADLVLIDPNEEWAFDLNQCFTKVKQCLQAYDGIQLKGRVKRTVLRGKTVFDGTQITASAGYGHFIQPD